tara:strand:- start:4331 stop:4753 length:423 start_codon:yes stop_codon:yes gene_type:complete
MPALNTNVQFNLADTKKRLLDDFEQAKSNLAEFNQFLEDRYLADAKEKLHAEGKDFGTVSLIEGNTKVKVELRKRIEWDQEGLKNFFNSLSQENAIHYAKVSFSITESRYNNAPPELQKRMEDHRTVNLQGVKITFEENE